MRKKRGFTLVEMVMALTAGSVIMGIAVGMLHMLMNNERLGRDHTYRLQVLTRLAEQFRDDAHTAVGIDPRRDGDSPLCRFHLPEGRVASYYALPGELRREESKGGTPIQWESYSLSDGYSAAVSVNEDFDPPTADLIVRRDASALGSAREMQVTAMIGKDRAFQRKSDGDQ